jgi:NRPS condensation-like uncharacterized protein
LIRLNRSEYGSLASEPYLGSVVIAVVIRFDSPMPLERIKEALRDLTLAVPRLRANIVPTWTSYKMGILPHDEWLDEAIDSAVTVLPHIDPDAPGVLEALQTQVINSPMLLTRGLPWYAWYIPHPERPLLLHNIHHMVGDGASISQIHRALFARLNGTPIEPFPIDSSSQLPGVAPLLWWQWPRSILATLKNALDDARQAKGEHIVTLATRQSDRYTRAGMCQIDLPGGLKAAKLAAKQCGTTVNTLVSAIMAQVLLSREASNPKAVAVLRIAVDLRRYFPKGAAPRIGNYVVNIVVKARHQPNLQAQVASLTEQVKAQLGRYDRREGALACVALEALTYVITQGTLAKAFLQLKAKGALNKTSLFVTNVGSTAGMLPEGSTFGLTDYSMMSIGPSFFVALISHGDRLQLGFSHQIDEIPRSALDEYLHKLDRQYRDIVMPVTDTPPA